MKTDVAELAEEEQKSGCCNLHLVDAILMEAYHKPTMKPVEFRYRPQTKSPSNLRHSASRRARSLHGIKNISTF